MGKQVLTGLLAGFLALSVAAEVESSDDVTVSIPQSVYAVGDSVNLVLENNSGRAVFVPGCHPFEVEAFEEDRYRRVSREPCSWEDVAVKLPPGKHEFSYQTSSEASGGIYRIAVVYGWGCRDDLPLSLSRCEDFTSVSSGSFRVGQGE